VVVTPSWTPLSIRLTFDCPVAVETAFVIRLFHNEISFNGIHNFNFKRIFKDIYGIHC
jgi:hypothetical protein